MQRRAQPDEDSLSTQMRRRAGRSAKSDDDKNVDFISTGSTLLDLAISGGRTRGGGIPEGILVEIFGPAACGKTVMLCEIAGRIKRGGGEVRFNDPEGRINKQYASIFGLDVNELDLYERPSTVTEVFAPILKWHPKKKNVVHGLFADSLAALSTEMEMDAGGDSFGGRRAREFSEQLRITCRTIPERRILMVCSNQVRQNINAGPYAPKYRSPGGEAIGFYASLRLQCLGASKIKKSRTIEGEKIDRVVGVQTDVRVFKSSVWKPFREATVTILFDYGIDDIRGNLQFLKEHSKDQYYSIDGKELDSSIERAIEMVEDDGLEKALRDQVIDTWERIEEKFDETSRRKPRVRE